MFHAKGMGSMKAYGHPHTIMMIRRSKRTSALRKRHSAPPLGLFTMRIVSAGLALEVAVDCVKFQCWHALRLALIALGGGLSRALT